MTQLRIAKIIAVYTKLQESKSYLLHIYLIDPKERF
jgi:hypothetical protein